MARSKLRLDPKRRAAVRTLLAREGGASTREVVLASPSDARSHAPSFSQQRLWFLDRFLGGQGYNMFIPVSLAGEIDVDALQRTLTELVRRHESLRTVFPDRGGEPRQEILEPRPVELVVSRLDELEPNQRAHHYETRARRIALAPFVLSEGPLFRAHLFSLEPGRHMLVLSMHHIVADGWSLGVLMRELSEIYGAYSEGRPSPLPEPTHQYRDFSSWQRNFLQGQRRARLLEYWRTQLEAVDPLLTLPSDHRAPPVPSHRGDVESITLERELTDDIKQLAASHGSTPFMTILAAFGVLVSRLALREQFLIGTPIANRTRREFESLVGFFVNTLVLRLDLRDDPTFEELLARVRATTLGAYEHQDLPFEVLVAELQPERDLAHNPLFQVLFAFTNDPMSGEVQASSPDGMPEIRMGTSKFDLGLFGVESNVGLNLTFEYSTDLFERRRIRSMLEQLELVLMAAVARPSVHVEEIPLTSASEARMLRDDWSRPPVREVRAPVGPLARIDAQCTNDASAIAVTHGSRTVSYGELWRLAERIAGALIERGVGEGDRVVVALGRSVEQVASVLAIRMVGACHVPLDLGLPAGVLEARLGHANPRVALVDKDELPAGPWASIRVDRELPPPTRPGEWATGQLSKSCYLLFTSGSTGVPKAVDMGEQGLAALIEWQIEQSIPRPRTLQFAPLSFDVAYQELFSTLGAGGELVIVDEDTRRDPDALLELLQDAEIERLFLPFVALNQLAEAYARRPAIELSLREVVTAGEQLTTTPDLRWMFSRLPECRLKNQYGPTETHVVSELVLPADPEQWPELPPIGRPVAGARLYVLDGRRQLVPVGAWGELHVGGRALANGYAGAPEQTQERFVDDPFDPDAGSRLYRTGDLVRWRFDGELEFIGRRDQQVKIRGHRVEIAHVEAMLAECPHVAAVAVTTAGENATTRRLVAYVVPDHPTPRLDLTLRRAAAKRLPDYMVPSVFVELDSLPLTPTGKVDRLRLPPPTPVATTGFVAPRTELESTLVQIFERVLEREGVGVHDNFFEIGGHSLLATQTVVEIEREVGVSLPLRRLFEDGTVAELALTIDELRLVELDGPQTDEMLRALDALSDEDTAQELSAWESN